jgi:hypothetical protein
LSPTPTSSLNPPAPVAAGEAPAPEPAPPGPAPATAAAPGAPAGGRLLLQVVWMSAPPILINARSPGCRSMTGSWPAQGLGKARAGVRAGPGSILLLPAQTMAIGREELLQGHKPTGAGGAAAGPHAKRSRRSCCRATRQGRVRVRLTLTPTLTLQGHRQGRVHDGSRKPAVPLSPEVSPSASMCSMLDKARMSLSREITMTNEASQVAGIYQANCTNFGGEGQGSSCQARLGARVGATQAQGRSDYGTEAQGARRPPAPVLDRNTVPGGQAGAA